MNRTQPHNFSPPGRGWYLYGIALLCSLAVLAIGSPVMAEENSSIPCGVVLPLSGNFSPMGNELLQGIELAVDEINADGGIFGRVIDLHVEDNQCDAQVGLKRFQELRAAGIPAVIGAYHATLTLPMAEDTRQNQSTILLCPWANADILYGISPAFYQEQAPIFYLATFVSEWVSFTAERVAIISIDTDFGRSLTDGIISGLDNRSITITGVYPAGEGVSSDDLSRQVIDGAPDTVVFAMYTPLEVSLLKSLSAAGYRGQIVLTDSENMNTLETEERDMLANFSVFTISTETSLVPGSHTDQFVKAYQAKYNADLTRGSIAGYGYDSMMTLAQAMKSGGGSNITAPAIQDGLARVRYYGVTGPKVFDEKNAVRPALERWVYEGGKFELMGTSVI